jgi:hypothetical protein
VPRREPATGKRPGEPRQPRMTPGVAPPADSASARLHFDPSLPLTLYWRLAYVRRAAGVAFQVLIPPYNKPMVRRPEAQAAPNLEVAGGTAQLLAQPGVRRITVERTAPMHGFSQVGDR